MRCGHCSGEHETVLEVRRCAGFLPAEPAVRARPATERQLDYAHALLRDRQPYGVIEDVELTNSLEAAHEYLNGMDFEAISEFIATMKSQPKRVEKSRTMDILVDEGMYMKDGAIFKVQRAVHGSGHLYAKRLTESGFEFAPGIVAALRPEDKMTVAQAKEYGALYGTCCVCGRTLTDEKSIEAGIGPICGGKADWFA